MKIALGSDHRGTKAIDTLVDHLRGLGHEPVVLGPHGAESSDYPDSAYLVGREVHEQRAPFGVLVCGSGVGMAMAANKVPGVRAAAVCDEEAAEMTRRHNDANVLCLSSDRCTPDQLLAITDAFLATAFDGGRHARRIGKIEAIERGEDPRGRRD